MQGNIEKLTKYFRLLVARMPKIKKVCISFETKAKIFDLYEMTNKHFLTCTPLRQYLQSRMMMLMMVLARYSTINFLTCITHKLNYIWKFSSYFFRS